MLALLLRLNVREGRVTGPSMSPTYENGDTVLVWKSAPRSLLKPGMVIIFRDTNGDELIKRIAFYRPAVRPSSSRRRLDYHQRQPEAAFAAAVQRLLRPYCLR